MNFEYVSPTKVEETAKNRAIISGVLAQTGISKNGNFYDISTIREVAKTAVGRPIYFGVKTGINPETGKWTKGLHDVAESNRIGKIFKTTFNRKNGVVKFFGEIWNNAKFPKIVSEVAKGFGISLQGFVENAKSAVDGITGRLITIIKNLTISSVQLFAPDVIRGIESAKVETVQIQESMVFCTNRGRKLKISEIVAVLEATGEI